MEASARRRSYDIESLRLEAVDELEYARGICALQRTACVREERLGRPIGPNGGAQRDLWQMEARVLDVAEDSFACTARVPHWAHRHGPKNLRRAREETVGVFHLIVPRGDAELARHAEEHRTGGSPPRGIRAAAGALAPEVQLGAQNQRAAIDGEVTREQGALQPVGRGLLRSVDPRDAHGHPGNGNELGTRQGGLATIVVYRDVPPVRRDRPHVEPRRYGVMQLHSGELAGPRVGEVERIRGDEVERLRVAIGAH